MVDGVPKPISSIDELQYTVRSALESGVTALSLVCQKGAPPKKWEKIVYPLLGLKVPEDISSLSVHPSGADGSVSYEEEEIEWVPEGADKNRRDKVEFKTAAGETFIESGSELVPTSVAILMMEEFFSKRKKPSLVRWRRTN